MNLKEIETRLPNGLHDAILHCIEINYQYKKAKFSLEILIGGPLSREKKPWRMGELVLFDLCYCIIDAPFSDNICQKNELTIDSGSMKELKIKPKIKLPKNVPDSYFKHWFFINEWNSFIYFAAKKAQFKYV